MTRHTRSIATASWIDERLFSVRIPEVDSGSIQRYSNSTSIDRAVLTGDEAFRFSNFLEAWIEVGDGGRITQHGWTDASAMYRSPSFFGIESEVFPTRRHVSAEAGSVTFRQLVGCRTRSPEVIAEVIGGACGFSLGMLALVPVPGAVGGSLIGREVVEEISVFPPIWTELSLRINADGTTTQELLRHSRFPSNCFYTQDATQADRYQRLSIYDARTHLEDWLAHGWGSGNPWHIPDPSGSLGDNRSAGSHLGASNRSGQVQGSVASRRGAVQGGARSAGPVSSRA